MLKVQVLGNRVALRGCAPSYYVKQLALHAALEVLGPAAALGIDLDVKVASIPSSPNPEPL
jgi:hypothetical protein